MNFDLKQKTGKNVTDTKKRESHSFKSLNPIQKISLVFTMAIGLSLGILGCEPNGDIDIPVAPPFPEENFSVNSLYVYPPTLTRGSTYSVIAQTDVYLEDASEKWEYNAWVWGETNEGSILIFPEEADSLHMFGDMLGLIKNRIPVPETEGSNMTIVVSFLNPWGIEARSNITVNIN